MRTASRLRANSSRLYFENLEARLAPANLVTASLVGGVLTLTGDDSPNVVTIKIEDTQVTLTPDGDTDVGGIGGIGFSRTIQGTATSLKANMKGGDDQILADPATKFVLSKGATIDLGDGINRLELNTSDKVNLGSLTVTAADGFDTVKVIDGVPLGSQITGNVSLKLGQDGTDVSFRNIALLGAKGLSIISGDGDDNLALTNVTGGKPVSATWGNGFSYPIFDGSQVGAISLSGNDNELVVTNNSTTGAITASGISQAKIDLDTTSVVNGNVGIKASGFYGEITLTLTNSTVHGNVSATTTGRSGTIVATLTTATIDGSAAFKPMGALSNARVNVSANTTLGSFTGQSAGASTDIDIDITDTVVNGPIKILSTGKDDVDVSLDMAGTNSASAITVTGGYGSYVNVNSGVTTLTGDINVKANTLFSHIEVNGGQLIAKNASVSAPSEAEILMDGGGTSMTLTGSLTATSDDSANISVSTTDALDVDGAVQIKGKGTSIIESSGATHLKSKLSLTGEFVNVNSFDGTFNVDGDLTGKAGTRLDVNLAPALASTIKGKASFTGGLSGDSFRSTSLVTFLKDLTIDLKDGFNSANLTGTVGAPTVVGNLSITGGAGNDSVEISNASMVGTTTIKTGAGADGVALIDESTFTGAVSVDTGSGVDFLELANRTGSTGPVTFTGKLIATTGTGNDFLFVGRATGGPGGDGNSKVIFAVAGSTIDGGTGLDVFTLANAQFDNPANVSITGF